MDGFGERARQLDVRLARLDPQQIGVRGEGEAAADDRIQTRAHAVEAFTRALAGRELLVARVDVAGEQVGREGVGARDDDRRHTGDVSRETRGVQRPDVLLRRHEHLAAEVAALLLAGQLVLPVDAGGAGLDHRLRQFVGVQRPAEPGLGVGDDGRHPVAGDLSLGVLDAVLAHQRVVDAAHDRRHGVGGVQALVRVGLSGEISVGGDLPAGEVDGLQPRAHLLHGLAAGVGAQCADVFLGVKEVPEVLGAPVREGLLLAHRAAQADDVVGRVGAFDAVPSRVGVPDPLELGCGLRLIARAEGRLSGGGEIRHRLFSWCCPWRRGAVGRS